MATKYTRLTQIQRYQIEELLKIQGIEQTHEIVNRKERFGDWEIDTVVGACHKYFLVTIAKRITQFTKIGLIKKKTKRETTSMTIELLKEFNGLNSTITSDNGKEFAGHEDIARELNIKFYFAKPYHSWQRGLNEYHNKLIRQYFPKDKDFSKLSVDQVKQVERLLNHRPRKTLGYFSPQEVLLQQFPHLVSALGN